MSASLLVLRSASLALTFAAVLYIVNGVLGDVWSAPYRAFAAHVARLDRDLDLLFQPRRGRLIAATQLGMASLLSALAIASASPWPLLGLLVVSVAPILLLRHALVRRRRELEQRLPEVAKCLANALRSLPHLAGALAQTERLSPPSVARELELMLEEVRLGSALEPALLRMCARARSHDLDALVAGMLIARQTGGNLPEILETLADSLREMARLSGVLRSKTGETRAQFAVVGALPVATVVLGERLMPGYFEPLFASPKGWAILVAAVVAWAASLLIARKVMAVEL